jgi:uncharacterized membrane protein SpoIIM required for sporulation
VQRAWYQVYGPRRGFIAWLRQFLTGGWARAVRELWLDLCIALAAMIAGVIAGWVLVARNQDWYYALVPMEMGGVRAPGASREALAETLRVESETGGLSAFAAYLFYNNASVSILVFALGFAFGVPSLMLLVHNMALLGAMLWLYNSVGLLPDFLAWLAVHGTTELSAILLAGAAGLNVGRQMAFPGQRSIMQATASAGRRAGVVMVGVVIMLIFAAVLEAFPRQLAGSGMRTIIGISMAFVWLLYFSLSGRDWRQRGAA